MTASPIEHKRAHRGDLKAACKGAMVDATLETISTVSNVAWLPAPLRPTWIAAVQSSGLRPMLYNF